MNLVVFDYLHKLVSLVYILFLKIFNKQFKIIGCKGIQGILKTSDTIFIMAPGSSINSYSKKDFDYISQYDSMGVNNFLIHEFICSSYLLETQPKKRGYFKLVSELNKLESIFLYKGYASLKRKKFNDFLDNINDIPKKMNKFYFLKDAYAKGAWDQIDEKFKSKMLNMSKSDFIYNYISSLNYAVMLAYKLGYKNIVLSGFDMDDKYFYCENRAYKAKIKKYNLCVKSDTYVNTINQNKNNVKDMMMVLNEVNSLLKIHREGSITTYRPNKVLSTFFKVYNDKQYD